MSFASFYGYVLVMRMPVAILWQYTKCNTHVMWYCTSPSVISSLRIAILWRYPCINFSITYYSVVYIIVIYLNLHLITHEYIFMWYFLNNMSTKGVIWLGWLDSDHKHLIKRKVHKQINRIMLVNTKISSKWPYENFINRNIKLRKYNYYSNTK